jgi:hypothetical protein
MNKSVNLDLKYLILDHCKEVLKAGYDLDALAYAKRRQFLDEEGNVTSAGQTLLMFRQT